MVKVIKQELKRVQTKGFDFKYCLEYDYDSHKECESHGCNDEGICRCSTIINSCVISVNVSLMVDEVYNSIFDNSLSTKRNSKINTILGGISKEVDIYTIDRVLRINSVYEPSNWEIQICGGYYGQEIDNIILEDYVSSKIDIQLEEAFNITDLGERIEYLLKLEYGHILPELKGCQYEVSKIERDKVIFGSDNQYQKVATEKLDHYSDKKYKSYRGILIPKGDKYRLIDGYHRCFASEDKMIDVILVR